MLTRTLRLFAILHAVQGFCRVLHWLIFAHLCTGIWVQGEAKGASYVELEICGLSIHFIQDTPDTLLSCRMRSSVWRLSSGWVMPMLAAAERSAKECCCFYEVLIDLIGSCSLGALCATLAVCNCSGCLIWSHMRDTCTMYNVCIVLHLWTMSLCG